MLPGMKDVTEVPALKSAPSVRESSLSRFTSTKRPTGADEAAVKFDNGKVVDRFAVVVGAMVQIDALAQVPMVLAVSFSIVRDGFANVSVTDVKLPAGIFVAVVMYAMSVCSRVSSTVVEPEKRETFPGEGIAPLSVAPVSVTFAERILTAVGGLSVMASTTDEFPLFCCCEPN